MRFRKTYIEITNVCDLSCDFCPKTTRPPQYMSRALFAHVLSQVRECSRLLHFHVLGEPMLHPEIGLFFDMCEQEGFRVNLITNGRSLARAGQAILGKPALRQVSVSVHSLSPEMGEPEIQRFFEDVLTFTKEAEKHSNLPVVLRLWNRSAGARPDFQAAILGRIQKAFSLPFSLENALSNADSVVLGHNRALNRAPRFEWPDFDNQDYGAHGTCLGLREQVAVLSDGTVVPCCLDRNGAMNLGNIQESPLSRILSGERACGIRDGFRQGVIVEELCRRCSYRGRFSRALCDAESRQR